MSRGIKGVTLIELGPCRTWWVRVWGSDQDTQVASELVPAAAAPGTPWKARVDNDGHILAIVAPFDDPDVEVRRERRRSRPPVSAPTRPLAVLPAHLAPGDVVTALVEFTGDPGPQDACLAAKPRPNIVVAVHRRQVVLRPVFKAHGYQSRIGAPPIRDWYHAGLEKPSVASCSRVVVAAEDVIRKIGRLSERDDALWRDVA